MSSKQKSTAMYNNNSNNSTTTKGKMLPTPTKINRQQQQHHIFNRTSTIISGVSICWWFGSVKLDVLSMQIFEMHGRMLCCAVLCDHCATIMQTLQVKNKQSFALNWVESKIKKVNWCENACHANDMTKGCSNWCSLLVGNLVS